MPYYHQGIYTKWYLLFFRKFHYAAQLQALGWLSCKLKPIPNYTFFVINATKACHAGVMGREREKSNGATHAMSLTA